MPRPLEGAGALMKKGPRSTEKLKEKKFTKLTTDHIAIDQRTIEKAVIRSNIKKK
jgi:hypothetical protein